MQNEQTPSLLQQKRPLVSFIVTTYNMPHQLLRECLESIGALGLDDDECEIVLVDDGSEVTPLAELSDWQDRMVYLRQQNYGLSVARNNGLRIATGHYIQFVDGDDCLLSNTYRQCLQWVKEHDADMMLFGLNTQSARDSEDDIAIEGPMTGASYLHNHNLRASACGYLFRRLMLDNLRFTPGIYHEDEEFTPLLLLKADQLYFTEADAYYYGTAVDGLSLSDHPPHPQQGVARRSHQASGGGRPLPVARQGLHEEVQHVPPTRWKRGWQAPAVAVCGSRISLVCKQGKLTPLLRRETI